MRNTLAITAAALVLGVAGAMAQGSGASGDIGGSAAAPAGAGMMKNQPATTGIGISQQGTKSGSAPRVNDAREQRMNGDMDVRRGSKPNGTQ